jgi:Tol biopolymer transport system component
MQVVNADGSDIHVLLEGPDACCETEWSPNGDRIVYQLSVGQGDPFTWDSEVWTISPDGSNPIKLFDSDGCDMAAGGDALPVWAPNGTQVAYNACSAWVVANADGTGDPQPIDELLHRSWGGGALSGWDLF